LSGTELHPDNGGKIVNWPKQNHENGVAKNSTSGRQFKTVTRILKRLRYELIEEGHDVADRVPSFLIECLVWNVLDDTLNFGSLKDNVRETIRYLWHGTKTDAACNEWIEVNERKYLFRASQPWKREDAHAFLLIAWQYIGFK